MKISDAENETPTQATIEITQSAIEKTQNQTGVVYDTSLEYTLEKMKTVDSFFKTLEWLNSDIFWIGVRIEKSGASRFQIGKDVRNTNTDSQNVPFDTTEDSITKLGAINRVKYRNNLDMLNYRNCNGGGRQSKLGRFKNNTDKLDNDVKSLNTSFEIKSEYDSLQDER